MHAKAPHKTGPAAFIIQYGCHAPARIDTGLSGQAQFYVTAARDSGASVHKPPLALSGKKQGHCIATFHTLSDDLPTPCSPLALELLSLVTSTRPQCAPAEGA